MCNLDPSQEQRSSNGSRFFRLAGRTQLFGSRSARFRDSTSGGRLMASLAVKIVNLSHASLSMTLRSRTLLTSEGAEATGQGNRRSSAEQSTSIGA